MVKIQSNNLNRNFETFSIFNNFRPYQRRIDKVCQIIAINTVGKRENEEPNLKGKKNTENLSNKIGKRIIERAKGLLPLLKVTTIYMKDIEANVSSIS